MREIFRVSISYKINWTKVCLVGAILTVGGIALQMSILPYPLHTWFISRPATVILYESMEETVELKETHKNSTERLQLIPLNSVVSHNATDQMVQLVSVNQEKETAPKRRKSSRRRKHAKLKEKPIVLTPPPPPRRPSSALEVWQFGILSSFVLMIKSKIIVTFLWPCYICNPEACLVLEACGSTCLCKGGD